MTLASISRRIFWSINHLFFTTWFTHSWGLKTDPSSPKLPDGAFIMVANHASFFDPWLVASTSKRLVSIMMNDDGFKAGAMTRAYLVIMRNIRKRKGASDMKSVRTTLKRLAEGTPVLIFPEGQVCWDGETQPMYPGIEKILRKAKVPLVIVTLRGNFLSKPWWAETRRKGTITRSHRVITTDQLATMTDDNIISTIRNSLYTNEIKESITPFTGHDLCEGLTKLVWRCPTCGSEDGLSTAGNDLYCRCGSRWKSDANLHFTPVSPQAEIFGDLHDLVALHKTFVKNKIEKASESDVLAAGPATHVETAFDGSYTHRREGRLTLTKTSLIFEGQYPEASFTIACKQIADALFQKKEVLEVRSHNDSYQFLIEGHSLMKWVYFLRYMGRFAESEAAGWYVG